MANWSELPEEITSLFAERLPCIKQFIRFSSVCKSWRSGAANAKTKTNKPFFPWMIMSNLTGDQQHAGEGIPYCYSFFGDKVFTLSLPELHGKRCWGTQYGWLITQDPVDDSQIHLYNPLTKTRFPLPPTSNTSRAQRTWYEFVYEDHSVSSTLAQKFALSSNPSESSESVVVMAIFGGRNELAFASPKHQSWISVDSAFSPNHDLLFFQNRFYSITALGTLRTCDFNGTTPLVALDIAPPPPNCDMCGTKLYLAEISGGLHLIVRRFRTVTMVSGAYQHHHLRTYCFNVYKFDFDRIQWVQVKGLENNSVFVGNNTTFAISIADHPEFKLKPNSIYFSGNQLQLYGHKFCDMGVYDMSMEAIIEPFYKQADLPSDYSWPFFFMPSLA